MTQKSWHLNRRTVLKELDREVRESGARLVITGMSKHIEKDLDAEFLRAEGLDVLVIPRPSDDEAPLTHFKNDSHWNDYGHRRVADILIPKLSPLVDEVLGREE